MTRPRTVTRRTRVLLPAVLCTVLATSASSAVPAPRATAARSSSDPAATTTVLAVGLSPGFALIDLPPARLRADLDAIRRSGASWVRVDLSWARVESVQGRRDWADTDRVLGAARRAGLRVLAVVGYRPAWGALPDGSAAPAAFGRFVDAAARRYARRVAAWEVWNEPNLAAAWSARPSPAAYARLVGAAAPGIRRHDPGADVVIGALAPAVDARDGSQVSPLTFLRRLYADGLDRRLFDAVSVHPYSYPALPGGGQQWNTFSRLPDLHGVLRRAGDGATPLWLTEYGAPTGRSDRAVTPTRQARMIAEAVRRARAHPFVATLFIYALRDARPDLLDPEANFGLLRHGGRPKPGWTALRRTLGRS